VTLSNVQLLKTPAAVVSMKSEREVTALLQVTRFRRIGSVSVRMHVLGLQLWFQREQLFTGSPRSVAAVYLAEKASATSA
jgi:hypothetical protein